MFSKNQELVKDRPIAKERIKDRLV